MYNPARPPFVSHYRGTELMLAHIERLICATTSSGDVFGGASHTFSADKRPHLAVMLGEDEYKTGETVPAFLEAECGRDFRISYIVEAEPGSGDFSGSDTLAGADVLFVSVRRRALPRAQLDAVRAFAAKKGTVVGIRTSSHAFALRGSEKPPADRDVWPEFDADVLGGNYQGHHGNDAKTFAVVSPVPSNGTVPAPHPILDGIPRNEFPTGGSLYRNTPLREGTTVLLTGRAEGIPRPEPIAWTHEPKPNARVFYTSLGHVDDFKRPEFRSMLANAVRWVASVPTPSP
jgi:hypothetical protein